MCLYYSFSVLTSLFYSKYRHYKILSFFLCLGLDLWSNYLNTFTTYLQYWPLNPKLIDRILWIPVPDVWTEIERQRERKRERVLVKENWISRGLFFIWLQRKKVKLQVYQASQAGGGRGGGVSRAKVQMHFRNENDLGWKNKQKLFSFAEK